MNCSQLNRLKTKPKSEPRVQLKALSALLAVTLLVACAKPRTGPGAANPSDLGKDPSSTAGQRSSAPAPHAAMGTGDTGGGNGVNGAVFESYVRDITTLPEWKTYIEPIHQKFMSIAKDPKYPNRIMRIMARSKKWYFVPLALGDIPKDRIGLDITSDPIQQFALQTRKEIWIDSKLYEQMSDQKKALLLVHEMIMSLYLVRFEDFTTLCREFVDTEQEGQDPSDCESEYIKEYFSHIQPEPRRSLIAIDYQAIRSMTSWLFTEYSKMTKEAEFQAELRKHGFDKRLTEHEGDSKPELNSDQKSLETLLKGFARLGYLPKYCAFDANLNATNICELEFDFPPKRNAGDRTKLVMTLTRKSLEGAVLSTQTSTYSLDSVHSSEAYRSGYRGAPQTWSVRLSEDVEPESLALGRMYYDLNILLDGDKDSPSLFAIQLEPTSVFDIQPECEYGNNVKNAIEVSFGRPKNSMYDELFVYSNPQLPAARLPQPYWPPRIWKTTHFAKDEHSATTCPNFALLPEVPKPLISEFSP